MNAMSEQDRDQLGMQDDWRYTGAKLVVNHCLKVHVPLARAGVSMDQSGRPVLVGQMWDDERFEPVGSECFPADCPTIGDEITAKMANISHREFKYIPVKYCDREIWYMIEGAESEQYALAYAKIKINDLPSYEDKEGWWAEYYRMEKYGENWLYKCIQPYND